MVLFPNSRAYCVEEGTAMSVTEAVVISVTKATGLNPGLLRKGWADLRRQERQVLQRGDGSRSRAGRPESVPLGRGSWGARQCPGDRASPSPHQDASYHCAYDKSICIFTTVGAHYSHLENLGWKVLSLPSESLRNRKSKGWT